MISYHAIWYLIVPCGIVSYCIISHIHIQPNYNMVYYTELYSVILYRNCICGYLVFYRSMWYHIIFISKITTAQYYIKTIWCNRYHIVLYCILSYYSTHQIMNYGGHSPISARVKAASEFLLWKIEFSTRNYIYIVFFCMLIYVYSYTQPN